MTTQAATSRITPRAIAPSTALHRTFGGYHHYAATAFGWYKLVCWLQDNQWQWRLESPDGKRQTVGYAQLQALVNQGLVWLIHESDVARTPLPVGEMGREDAHALHVELGRAGVRNHYAFAARALRREKVYRLSLLTVSQRNTVRNEMKARAWSRPQRTAAAA